MSYMNDNVKVTPVYVKEYIEKYVDVYTQVYNSLGEIKEVPARVSATNGFMMSFTQAIGMDKLGAVSFDESLVGTTDGFKTFATFEKSVATAVPTSASKQTNFTPQAPAQDGGKTPYRSNGKPLEGDATEKQIATLEKFLNGKGDDLKKIVYGYLAKIEKASVDELSKQEASDLIDACFAKINAGKQ